MLMRKSRPWRWRMTLEFGRFQLSTRSAMRRASTLASFALQSRSIATDHGGTAAASHGLLQVALYSTSRSTGSQFPRRWFKSFSGGSARNLAFGVGGTLASVAVATSLAQEVYAREPPPADLVPKEVVLYQYEACPFCNKVKEIGRDYMLKCEFERDELSLDYVSSAWGLAWIGFGMWRVKNKMGG